MYRFILGSATSQSLVLCDEVGRSTSTKDGAALAFAIAEYILKEVRCLTLFTSHFAELGLLCEQHHEARQLVLEAHAGTGPSSTLDHAATKLHFTYSLKPLSQGTLPDQYGVALAQAAGMHPDVVAEASELSRKFDRRILEWRQGWQKHLAPAETNAGPQARQQHTMLRDLIARYVLAIRQRLTSTP